MMVKVLMFAQARAISGHPMLQLDVCEGADIREVKSALLARCPDLAELLPYCTFSVDQCYADDDEVVTGSSEIACIPPVSGG